MPTQLTQDTVDTVVRVLHTAMLMLSSLHVICILSVLENYLAGKFNTISNCQEKSNLSIEIL